MNGLLDEFAAILPRTALAISRPEVQAPRLIIWQHTDHRIQNGICPRIDRNSRNLARIGQHLPRKGQPAMLFERSIEDQPMPGQFTSRFRTQFVRKMRFKAGISEEEVQRDERRGVRLKKAPNVIHASRIMSHFFSLKGEVTPSVLGMKSSVRKQEAGRPSAFVRFALAGQAAQA